MLTPQAELELASAVSWIKFCELFPKLQLVALPRIQFNNRLRTTAARIHTEARLIEVASKLYKGNEKEYADVLIPHELAHMIDVDLYGDPGDTDALHHGKTWQRIMVAYGLPPDRYHNLK
jgi:predicted SprT family Zn-dependent metalloprotease